MLGSIYSEFSYGIKKPGVALLNIGEESSKGNDLVKSTYKLLDQRKDINFVGNIEGKELLSGDIDVVICDGFVGNVMLKTIEGAAVSIFKMMKERYKKNWIAKVGAFLSYPVFSYMKKKLDYSEYGGLLVGLNGITIITHGSTKAKGIKNAIKFAAKIAKSDYVSHSQQYFERKEL